MCIRDSKGNRVGDADPAGGQNLTDLSGRFKTKPYLTITRPVLAPAKVKIALVLPKAVRKAGTYTIRFETKAPVGKATRSATVKLEVLK